MQYVGLNCLLLYDKGQAEELKFEFQMWLSYYTNKVHYYVHLLIVVKSYE